MTAWWLTWLWQGIALTLAVSAAFQLMPRVNAATRYWIWWCTLGAVGAIGGMGAIGATGAHPTHLTHLSHPTHLILVPSAPDALIAIVVGVWIAIALVSLMRILTSLHAVFGLRDQCTAFPPDVEAALPLWLEARARRGATRPTRLMLCDAVRGATVLGFHRPCVAVPPSLLNALTKDELDQVVLHEYAHVQRWDDWTKLAQAVLQSALWIHPATAIMGRRLNLERELACDEWVVARTGLPKAYARCLTRAAEVLGNVEMEPVLGPALFSRRRDLVHRVNRLLAVRGQTRRNPSAAAILAGASALVAVAIQLRGVPLVGELAEVALPKVRVAPSAPSLALARPHPRPLAPGGFTPRAARRRFTTDEGVVRNRPHEPIESHEPVDPSESASFARIASASAPSATADRTAGRPIEPIEPSTSIILARSFDGYYDITETTAAPPEANPWQLAGAVGAEIGASARKTSVGIANTLTRAGVSLARRF